MMLGRKLFFLGAGTLALATGCAYLPGLAPTALKPVLEPVQQVSKPAGTAAGQSAVGRLDLAAGRLDAAIIRFQQALQLDPTLIEAHNGLGVAFGQQGRYDQAAAAFRDALALSPDSPYLLNNLGYAQMRAGQLDEAWVSLDRAHRLGRHNQHTAENLALLAQARQKAGGSATGAVPSAETLAAAPAARAGGVEPSASRLFQVSPGVYRLIDSAPSRLDMPAAPAQAVAPIEPPAVAPVRQAQLPRPAGQAAVSAGSAKSPAAAPAQDKALKAASVEGFEVSNGVGLRHLAGRTARALERKGMHVTRVSDYRLFGRQRTEIHYREGYRQIANAVGDSLPVKARYTVSKRLPQDINVRLVVGRDWSASQVAQLGEPDTVADAAQASLPATGSTASAAAGMGLTAQPGRMVSADTSRGWRYF